MSLSPKKEKKQKKSEPQDAPIEPKKQKKIENPRHPSVVEFESIFYPSIFRALVPFYTFVGFLEAESGKKLYYRYDDSLSMEEKQNPLVRGAHSIEEFKLKNVHLGDYILRLLNKDPIIKKEPITANITHAQFRELYNRLIDPQATELQRQAFPVHLWDVLPLTAFQFIIGASTLGAMQMAANELGKDLKLLIISEKVSHYFAQYVCNKYISPKTNAFASGVSGGQMQFRLSSGFGTSVMARTKWLLGCKEWFKDVIKVRNPAFDEIVEPQRTQVFDQAQAIYNPYIVANPQSLVGFPPLFTSMTPDQLTRFENYLLYLGLPTILNTFMDLKYEYDNLWLTHFPEVYWKSDK